MTVKLSGSEKNMKEKMVYFKDNYGLLDGWYTEEEGKKLEKTFGVKK
jgi:hypothetical protein